MTNLPSRHTLEAELERYQQEGNALEQARALMRLGLWAYVEDHTHQEDGATHSPDLAIGLFGQAWAAYEQAGNRRGVVRAIMSIAMMMRNPRPGQDLSDHTDLTVNGMIHMALCLCHDEENLSERAHLYRLTTTYDVALPFKYEMHRRMLACYETANDYKGQGNTLMYLISSYEEHDKPAGFQRAVALYRLAGDKQGEGQALCELGLRALNASEFDEALTLLDASYACLQQQGEIADVARVLLARLRLIARTQSYDRYLHEYALASKRLRPLKDSDLSFIWKGVVKSLWENCIKLAIENHDTATARYAYQQLIAYEASMGHAKHQGSIYWKWGQMEYAVGHREMGIALCQWGLTQLKFHNYFKLADYEKTLLRMRIEMTP
jgi:hypothetical protein